MDVSVIIPAYNEEEGIEATINELSESIADKSWEVIVVNDGSTDHTGEKLNGLTGRYSFLKAVNHKVNRGYGSAIVTGCIEAAGDIVVWYDADGQHRPEDLLNLIHTMKTNEWDYCIGVRGKDSFVDKSRKFGKRILRKIVNMLALEPMEDFNSGMRAFKREILLKYASFLPKRFGASTVTSFLMQEVKCYKGGYVPILVRKRVGTSTVRPLRDGIRTLSLIFHVIILFRPKEVFGILGSLFIIAGFVYGLWSALTAGLGVPILAAILCITGIQIFIFGLISSQISQTRLEICNLAARR